MAQPERRRVVTAAYLWWVSVVFVIVALAAVGYGGRGTMIAAFVASLALSGPAFVREDDWP